MAPAIAAALLAGGASLGSGLLSWKHDYDVMDYQYMLMNPQRRMQDMIAAGINPNAAAQGISGSVAGLASHSTPMPDLGSTLGNSANSLLQAKLNESVINKNVSETRAQDIENEINEDTMSDRKEIIRQTASKMKADNRISEANATIAEAYAQYAGSNALNDALIKQQQHSNLVKEWHKLQADIDKIDKDIELEDSEINKNVAASDLMVAQMGTEKAKQADLYASARKSNADAQKQEMENKFWIDNGFHSDDPLDVAYRNKIANGKEDEAEEMLNDVVEFTKEVNNASESGKVAAEEGHNGLPGQLLDLAKRIGKGIAESLGFSGVKPDSSYSYSDYRRDVRNAIERVHQGAYQALREGRINPQQYQSIMSRLSYMTPNRHNYNEYLKGNSTLNFNDLSVNP